MKRQSPDSVGRREERELFAEFAEDHNTCTFPHEKYYDLERWQRAEAAAGRGAAAAAAAAAAETVGMSEAASLLAAQQARRKLDAERADRERIEALKAHLRAAKEQNAAEYHDVVDQRRQKAMEMPSFESIAKQREEEKRRKEEAARRKFR